MKQIGYGILENGRPTGLWPRNFTSAKRFVDARKPSFRQSLQIVPVYVGEPISAPPPLPIPEDA